MSQAINTTVHNELIQHMMVQLLLHKDKDWNGKKVRLKESPLMLRGSFTFRMNLEGDWVTTFEFIDEMQNGFELNLILSFKFAEAWFTNGFNRVGPKFYLKTTLTKKPI